MKIMWHSWCKFVFLKTNKWGKLKARILKENCVFRQFLHNRVTSDSTVFHGDGWTYFVETWNMTKVGIDVYNNIVNLIQMWKGEHLKVTWLYKPIKFVTHPRSRKLTSELPRVYYEMLTMTSIINLNLI